MILSLSWNVSTFSVGWDSRGIMIASQFWNIIRACVRLMAFSATIVVSQRLQRALTYSLLAVSKFSFPCEMCGIQWGHLWVNVEFHTISSDSVRSMIISEVTAGKGNKLNGRIEVAIAENSTFSIPYQNTCVSLQIHPPRLNTAHWSPFVLANRQTS